MLPYSLVEIYQSLGETPFQGRRVNRSLLIAVIWRALRSPYGLRIESCLVTQTRRHMRFLSTVVTPYFGKGSRFKIEVGSVIVTGRHFSRAL